MIGGLSYKTLASISIVSAQRPCHAVQSDTLDLRQRTTHIIKLLGGYFISFPSYGTVTPGGYCLVRSWERCVFLRMQSIRLMHVVGYTLLRNSGKSTENFECVYSFAVSSNL